MSTIQVDRITPFSSSSVTIEGLSAPNLATTGSNTFVGNQIINGNLTASLQQGYAWVGGAGNVTNAVATSSFGGGGTVVGGATTGSNTFVGAQTITEGGVSILGESPSLQLKGNAAGSGSQYPSVTMTVAPNTYPGNIFGGISIVREEDIEAGATFIGMAANAYTPQYGPATVPMFIANGNNPDGNDTAIIFAPNGTAEHYKKSDFKYGVDVTGSLLVNGDVGINTIYTANFGYPSQAGGGSTVYISYSDMFNGSPSGNALIYWIETNFVGVTVNGPGVTNATVTGYNYSSNVEYYLSSGTVTSGETYTFTGPTYQAISITGSIEISNNVTVKALNGNTIAVTTDGFTTLNSNNQSANVNPGMFQLIDNNGGNRVLSFAATSSLMFNGGGTWQGGPQIAIVDDNGSDASIIGFQSSDNYTDGRLTILTPLVAEEGLITTGSTIITGSLTLNGSDLSSAWTSYTPTWAGASSNPAIGNGSITGAYKIVGKTCFVRGRILMGSSTTYGSGAWHIGLPTPAVNAYSIQLPVSLLNNSTAWYSGLMNGGRAGNTSYSEIQVQIIGGTAEGISSTFPFTWGDVDEFSWNGSYEIA